MKFFNVDCTKKTISLLPQVLKVEFVSNVLKEACVDIETVTNDEFKNV